MEGKEGRKYAQGDKGKEHHLSYVSNSDSTTDSESEASAANKRFKVILKGEEFKWSLPSSMVEYVNHHFNANIPDKDNEEQLLTENPVPSNPQQLKPLDNLIRSLLLPFQTVTTSDCQMERFQGKILDVMGPLSRLWKGLEDLRKASSDEAVEISVDKFVTIVEQVILLLGQVSLSLSYTRPLNILKMITNDLRKAEAVLKKNENILKESETHLFGKKFRSHIMEIEKSRKKSLEAFKDVGEKKSPFRKGASHSKSKLYGGGRCYYAGKPGIQTNIINMIDSRVRFKIIAKGNFNMEVQQHKVDASRKSKGGSFHQQLKTGNAGISDFDTSCSKKIIYRRNTKFTTSRKTISVCKTVEKITRSQGILLIVKAYQMPSTNLPL